MVNIGHKIECQRFGTCMIMLLVFLCSCNQKDKELIQHPMAMEIPVNFPLPAYDLSANAITREGFELGRKLFYDGRLSRDGSISCGNCHLQSSAFTHHGHTVSHGIDDKVGTRNAPAVMNLAWQKFFFWDGGVFNLDLVPLAPIENPVEMDEHMPVVIEKIKADENYINMFQAAFGNREVTGATILKALSQFMLQCVSANSSYDKFIRGEGPGISIEAKEGFAIFKSKCASCHSSELFTDGSFHNNGIIPSLKNDIGRAKVTLQEKDKYLFKTPSLRNVALTAPYMHDGRFRTLDMVLEHYVSGVMESPTLDSVLRKEGKTGIFLTDTEKRQLISFLNTLTDSSFIKRKELSEQ